MTEYNLDNLHFWGKINGKIVSCYLLICICIGTVKDYYICVSYDYIHTNKGFPSKKFYWCSSTNYILSTLPAPNDKYKAQFDHMRTFFTGEYEKVIIKVGGQGIVVDEDEGIVLPPK